MTQKQQHGAGFTALMLASLAFACGPLIKTFTLSWQSDGYTYILLILPFTLAILLASQGIAKTEWDWEPVFGAPLLLIAIALSAAARFSGSRTPGDVLLSIEMLAVVISWWGSFLLCFGRQSARRALFSLLLLLGVVPLPAAVMNCLVVLLQKGSAWSAHALFAVTGVPVIQHGILLSIPNLTIEVAQECSSIRSSTLLLVTAIISAKVLVRSPWHRLWIILLAIPLSVAKNGLRIFTIAMLGTRVDPAYLTGKVHHQGGILFFMVALAGIFVAITIARKRETLQESSSS